MKTFEGFDYVHNRAVSMTRAEWRQYLASLPGGRVVQRDHETFMYCRRERKDQHDWIAAEIYAQGILP